MDSFDAKKCRKQIEDAPPKCLITGLERCDSYTIDGNVVYVGNPAFDAYTFPEYSKEDKAFYRTKYDMDNDNIETHEWLCGISDLVKHAKFEEIKKHYGIEFDDENECHICGWYAAEGDENMISSTTPRGCGNPADGGYCWTEKYKCPICGEVFEIECSN